MNTTITGTVTLAFCPIKGVWCAYSNSTGCALTVPCYLSGASYVLKETEGDDE